MVWWVTGTRVFSLEAGSECAGTPIKCRYYNGVGVVRTTTSCSMHSKTPPCLLVTLLGLLLAPMPGIARVTPPTAELPADASVFPLQLGWTTDLGRAPAARPTYDDLHAYVPLRDGTLAAVRLIDGVTVWRVERPTRFAPAVGAGTVVVANGETLSALRASDAALLWSTQVGTPVSTAPLWAQGWLIALLEGGDVVALRGADGAELWRLALGGALLVPPTVGGAELFVPVADGRIVAVDLQTGRRLWEQTLDGSPQEILPLDALFVGATDNHFYRLSRRDGHVEWRWRTGGDIVGRPIVDRERVFFLSLDNVLRALDRNSGVQRWRSILSGRPRAGPAPLGNAVLVSGVSPQLRTFDTVTGRSSNVLEAPGELAAPPYIVEQPSESGIQMVLTIADGRLVGMRHAFGPSPFSLTFPPRPLLAEPRLRAAADVLPVGLPLLFDLRYRTSTIEVPPPGFTVQVAALRSAAAAAELARRLVNGGFPAYVAPRVPDGADEFYRVRVGHSLTRFEAEQLATRLSEEQQLDTYLVLVP